MSKAAGKLFNVASTLDMSGVTDADLVQTTKFTNRPKFLREPGVYDFTLTGVQVLDGRVDGAGKKWGTLRLVATEAKSGNIQRGFVDYPIESAMYTSKAGNPSSVKTKIFTSLVSSILGKPVKASELPKLVANIESTIVPGAQFRASVTYQHDHIERVSNGDTATFRIRLADGTIAQDESGDDLTFNGYEAASNYYTEVKGTKIRTGMDIKNYFPRTGELRKVVG